MAPRRNMLAWERLFSLKLHFKRHSHFDEFHSPVLRSPFLGVVVCDWPVRAGATRAQTARRDMRRYQRTHDSGCAHLGELRIVVMRPNIVGVPFNGQFQVWIILE